MTVFTNINELEKHLKAKFTGMMKSKELTEAGKFASKTMGRYVLDEVADGGASGYDYDQTGDFHKMLASESKHGNINQTPSTLSMGYGYLPELNDGVEAKRNFQTQKHWIGSRKKGRFVTINLKEESQMPKWIIAEFGAGKKAEGKVPSAFKISYSYRSGKEYMYGPSADNIGGVSSGSKQGYFMVGKDGFARLRGDKRYKPKTHPGIMAGKIFSRGLENSKKEVHDILSEGIRDYLNRI